MIWADYILLVIIGISALLSLWRGFFKEALSLITWLVAVVIAVLYFRPMGELLSGFISSPSVRNISGGALLFFSVLILGGILNYMVAQLVSKTGLTATDRMLGIIFGLIRGVVIGALIVLLAGLTTLPEEQWWSESLLIGYFQDLALWIRSFLPDSISQHIGY
ncbi:MAG: CvpA family protein [Gammaproteobacteria bacterium]